MPIAADKTLAYGRVVVPGDSPCIIFVSATKPATDRDWTEYCNWFQKMAKPGDNLRTLVHDRAGGPNAAQRKQLNDVTAPCNMHVAVLSSSAVGRGVVTAMNWFKRDSYRAFLPTELDDAIAYLKFSGATAAEVRKTTLDFLRNLDG